MYVFQWMDCGVTGHRGPPVTMIVFIIVAGHVIVLLQPMGAYTVMAMTLTHKIVPMECAEVRISSEYPIFIWLNVSSSQTYDITNMLIDIFTDGRTWEVSCSGLRVPNVWYILGKFEYLFFCTSFNILRSRFE